VVGSCGGLLGSGRVDSGQERRGRSCRRGAVRTSRAAPASVPTAPPTHPPDRNQQTWVRVTDMSGPGRHRRRHRKSDGIPPMARRPRDSASIGGCASGGGRAEVTRRGRGQDVEGPGLIRTPCGDQDRVPGFGTSSRRTASSAGCEHGRREPTVGQTASTSCPPVAAADRGRPAPVTSGTSRRPRPPRRRRRGRLRLGTTAARTVHCDEPPAAEAPALAGRPPSAPPVPPLRDATATARLPSGGGGNPPGRVTVATDRAVRGQCAPGGGCAGQHAPAAAVVASPAGGCWRPPAGPRRSTPRQQRGHAPRRPSSPPPATRRPPCLTTRTTTAPSATPPRCSRPHRGQLARRGAAVLAPRPGSRQRQPTACQRDFPREKHGGGNMRRCWHRREGGRAPPSAGGGRSPFPSAVQGATPADPSAASSPGEKCPEPRTRRRRAGPRRRRPAGRERAPRSRRRWPG
jgi:hypothetical protein